MNNLSLNINGFGIGDFKLPWVNSLIHKHNIAVVGIQETKRRSANIEGWLSGEVATRNLGLPDELMTVFRSLLVVAFC